MFERLAIPEVFLFTPKRIEDDRGFFSETFNSAALEPMTGPIEWVQDNHSRSSVEGTVRGLHFQSPPFAQAKLVRCVKGEIFDVVVDIRRGSPTFGKSVSAALSEQNGCQIYVPPGFAHGFITRVANTEVIYKVSNYYSQAFDRGIRFDDPALEIDWRPPARGVVLSIKDQSLPLLADLPPYFSHP